MKIEHFHYNSAFHACKNDGYAYNQKNTIPNIRAYSWKYHGEFCFLGVRFFFNDTGEHYIVARTINGEVYWSIIVLFSAIIGCLMRIGSKAYS